MFKMTSNSKKNIVNFLYSTVSILLCFVAFSIQIALWHHIKPFAWFIFYIALVISTRIGGVIAGLISTFLSTAIVWYYFIPPENIFLKFEFKYGALAFVFLFTGVLLTLLNRQIRNSKKLQKLIHIDLRKSESQLKRAQQIAKFGSWSWDIKKSKLQLSDEVYHIYGLHESETATTPEIFLNLTHPDDKAYLKETLDNALQMGKGFNIIHRIVLSDSSERTIQAAAEIYTNDKGENIEIIGTLHDITESKRNEERLRSSETKYRGLLETAYDAILLVDGNGIIEYANQQTKTWLGYDPTELIGRSIEILMPNRFEAIDIIQRMEFLKQPAARAAGKNIQLWVKRKDGSEFPVDISLSPFYSERGLIVTVFLRDITDQKAAENQLKFLSDTSYILSKTLSYEARIQHITNLSVPYLADWCSVHTYENESLKLSALAKSDALILPQLSSVLENKLLLDEDAQYGIGFVAKTGTALLLEQVSVSILQKIASENSEYLNQIKALNLKSLILVPMIIHEKHLGVITFARCAQTNYTEQDLTLANMVADRAAIALNNSKMYHEAKRAVKLREDVLAIVSHDLKNPLGIISGYTEIIANYILKNNKDSIDMESTEAIMRAVKQMERLIHDLLDFAKIESGTLSIDLKPCLAKKLIQDGIELVKHHARKKEIQFKIELHNENQILVCDRDRMKQVFANLLGNAIKFLPTNGRIEIKSSLKYFLDSPMIEFTVSDNGYGVEKEDMPYLFDRYWQAKETAKLGTGLGLAIVKGIIESHKGQIHAESAKGVGTTFYFSLPVEQKIKKSIQSETHTSILNPHENKKTKETL